MKPYRPYSMSKDESLSRPPGCYLLCGILTEISSHQDQCLTSAPGCVVLPILSQTVSPAQRYSQAWTLTGRIMRPPIIDSFRTWKPPLTCPYAIKNQPKARNTPRVFRIWVPELVLYGITKRDSI